MPKRDPKRTKLFRMVDGFKTYDKPFKPKYSDCKEVFNNINRNIFSNTLTKPKFIIAENDLYWGMCNIEEDNTITIYINKDFLSKKLFVFTLAHEMVHQWEWENNGTMSHGPAFFQWRDKLKSYNIVLTRAYRFKHYRLDLN